MRAAPTTYPSTPTVGCQRFGRTAETGYQCVLIAATRGPIRTKCGIKMAATHGFDDVGDRLDTLVVAGGCMNVEEFRADPALVEWVRSMAPRTRRVASICTRTFILGAAGLLNHRRVTTHWMFSELLATTFPLVNVNSSLLFARDGNIYSSGGITAGKSVSALCVRHVDGEKVSSHPV